MQRLWLVIGCLMAKAPIVVWLTITAVCTVFSCMFAIMATAQIENVFVRSVIGTSVFISVSFCMLITPLAARADFYESEQPSRFYLMALDVDEVSAWCRENLRGAWYITENGLVRIIDDEDAVQFKLRWL